MLEITYFSALHLICNLVALGCKTQTSNVLKNMFFWAFFAFSKITLKTCLVGIEHEH